MIGISQNDVHTSLKTNRFHLKSIIRILIQNRIFEIFSVKSIFFSKVWALLFDLFQVQLYSSFTVVDIHSGVVICFHFCGSSEIAIIYFMLKIISNKTGDYVTTKTLLHLRTRDEHKYNVLQGTKDKAQFIGCKHTINSKKIFAIITINYREQDL